MHIHALEKWLKKYPNDNVTACGEQNSVWILFSFSQLSIFPKYSLMNMGSFLWKINFITVSWKPTFWFLNDTNQNQTQIFSYLWPACLSAIWWCLSNVETVILFEWFTIPIQPQILGQIVGKNKTNHYPPQLPPILSGGHYEAALRLMEVRGFCRPDFSQAHDKGWAPGSAWHGTFALPSSGSSPLEASSMSRRIRLMLRGNCPLSSGTLDFMSFPILGNGILKKYTSPSRSWPRLPARPDIWKQNRITMWNSPKCFSYHSIRIECFTLFSSL